MTVHQGRIFHFSESHPIYIVTTELSTSYDKQVTTDLPSSYDRQLTTRTAHQPEPQLTTRLLIKRAMSASYATITSTPKPLPTPKERYDALIATYAAKPLRLVTLEVLGMLDTPLCAEDSPALPLVEHCVVVTVDTEAWTANTDQMTEIGIVIAEYKDGKEIGAEIGDYAENVMKKMKHHHLRICENAHLKTTSPWMRGPEGNRFGQSRFVTFAEARRILDRILNQPIVSDNPDLAGLKRPVILVGHALDHDTEHMQSTGLNYDFTQHATIVAEIDTQKLVRELSAWTAPDFPGNKIGLDVLCEQVFNFAHEDPHTALNDAARTIFCAVNLALRNWMAGRRRNMAKTMQAVATEIEEYSQDNFASAWGSVAFCTRCGGRDHTNILQQCAAPVYCLACERFGDTETHVRSHTERFCVHVAEFIGWKRRVIDARRKINYLPAGPPEGSHPPSKWRGIWPMESPEDVLVPERAATPPPGDFVRKPSDFEPVRPVGEKGVKVATMQSNARERAEKEKRVRKHVVRSVGVKKDGWKADDAWNGTAW
ncbi:hypothetical protein HBI23_215420 [Parastagonospora nodorum]|nr:hypothetical protein HBI23_215420 [Parastagonospora nodorum]